MILTLFVSGILLMIASGLVYATNILPIGYAIVGGLFGFSLFGSSILGEMNRAAREAEELKRKNQWHRRVNLPYLMTHTLGYEPIKEYTLEVQDLVDHGRMIRRYTLTVDGVSKMFEERDGVIDDHNPFFKTISIGTYTIVIYESGKSELYRKLPKRL